MTRTVPVYEWLQDDNCIGHGTQAELDHWRSEGCVEDGVTIGRVLCREPASEDARRAAAWERVAA